MYRQEADPAHIWDEYPERDYNNHPIDDVWIEITPELWDHNLGVLPPKAWKENAFAVGECAAHLMDYENKRAIPVYTMNVSIGDIFNGGRAFMADRAIDTFDPTAYTAEIKKQFSIVA